MRNIKAKIDKAKCTGCGDCVSVCPVDAIEIVDGKAEIDEPKCIGCAICANKCPEGAISIAESGVAPTVGSGTYPSAPRYGMGMGTGGGRGMGGGRGGGRGMGKGRGAGPSGFCVCPSCGAKLPHTRGVPCTSQKCPKCGSTMIRG
ncbi:MAG: hypothetical protein B6D65_05345 [candidate division Zixibacteria bacterium 4484_93]|nr:MAG: hypothetical protein B6D65_05345 [candidate division Zixibacteria bacterium 4484_93]